MEANDGFKMVTIGGVRKIALSFPEVTDEPHSVKISFSVKKKIYATYDDKNNMYQSIKIL